MTSLYERLGGAPAIEAAVDIFYGKVLADERLKHFFVNIDLARLRQHQKSFLTLAFGGPAAYSGRSLRAAHQGLVEQMGLNEGHFDAVVENLAATLQGLGVPPDLIGEVAAVAATVKDEVLGR